MRDLPPATPRFDLLLLRLGFSAFALAFVLPGHYPPWLSFEPQLMASFAFACVLPVLYQQARPGRLVPGLLGGSALALIPLPLIQYASGRIVFLSDAVLPAAYLSGFALCIIGGRNLAPAARQEAADLLFLSLSLAAGVSAALALSQGMQQYPIPLTNPAAPGARVYANLGQPNHLATLLALGCVGVLRAHARGVVGGGTAAVVVTWLSTSMVMTQSRTGWIEVALICAWLWFFGRHLSRPARPWALWVWPVAFAALTIAWEHLNTLLYPLPITLADRMDGGTRLLHWSSLWAAALEKPWLGYGWNQVGLAQLATATAHPATGEMLTNSHNTALDLVLWCGLPIGLTIVALLLWWFVRQIKAGLDEQQIFLILIFLLIGLHALTEYPLDYTYFLLPWGLAIGLMEAQPRPGSGRVLTRSTVYALFMLTVLLGAWIASEYLRVDAATREARLALIAGDNRSTAMPAPPQVLLLDGPREMHRMAITPAHAGMSPAALVWMNAVTDRFPVPPLLLRDALAAGLNAQPDRALRRLAQLCAIHRPARCKEAQDQWAALSLQHPLPQPAGWPSAGEKSVR